MDKDAVIKSQQKIIELLVNRFEWEYHSLNNMLGVNELVKNEDSLLAMNDRFKSANSRIRDFLKNEITKEVEDENFAFKLVYNGEGRTG